KEQSREIEPPTRKSEKLVALPTWYIGPEEIQRDLDRFIRYYNLERSHQGYRLKGRTPAQALIEALGVTELPDIVPPEEVTEPCHVESDPSIRSFELSSRTP